MVFEIQCDLKVPSIPSFAFLRSVQKRSNLKRNRSSELKVKQRLCSRDVQCMHDVNKPKMHITSAVQSNGYSNCKSLFRLLNDLETYNIHNIWYTIKHPITWKKNFTFYGFQRKRITIYIFWNAKKKIKDLRMNHNKSSNYEETTTFVPISWWTLCGINCHLITYLKFCNKKKFCTRTLSKFYSFWISKLNSTKLIRPHCSSGSV